MKMLSVASTCVVAFSLCFSSVALKMQARTADEPHWDSFASVISSYIEEWGQGCCDECAPSCAPTKGLMNLMISEAQKAQVGPDSEQADKLGAEAHGWYPYLQGIQSKYTSVADIFQKAEKTQSGEMTKAWVHSELNLSDGSFDLADSDQSGGLSYKELQDYTHLALELVGAFKFQGEDAYDGWAVGDFACLNGPPRPTPPECLAISREDQDDFDKLAEDQDDTDWTTFASYVSGYKESWNCCDACGPSCAPTKKLMDVITSECQKAGQMGKGSDQVGKMYSEVFGPFGWNNYLQEIQSKYTSSADIFQKAEKTQSGEMTKAWVHSELNLSDWSFYLADSDQSGGLSYHELQDYTHLASELVGGFHLGPEDFDGWTVSDFNCLTGPSRPNPPECSAISREDADEFDKLVIKS